MKIAVVILNWNGRQLLEDFLPSIVAFSPPEICDLYIADNASTDDSVDFIRKNTNINYLKNFRYAGG